MGRSAGVSPTGARFVGSDRHRAHVSSVASGKRLLDGSAQLNRRIALRRLRPGSIRQILMGRCMRVRGSLEANSPAV